MENLEKLVKELIEQISKLTIAVEKLSSTQFVIQEKKSSSRADW